MTEVRFGRDEHGAVTVIVPDGYEPLDQLLYDDLHGNRDLLDEILIHARNPPDEEWGIGGNSCWISISADAVIVENEYSGQTAILSHPELIEIIEAYVHELDVAAVQRRE